MIRDASSVELESSQAQINTERRSPSDSTSFYRLKGITSAFSGRQMDVFSRLAQLESAHDAVVAATSEEREAISQSSWRPAPILVAEDLEAEKQEVYLLFILNFNFLSLIHY
ncbi:unnamed protein product [Protopolystoma xenopodis]|uniref:Uncharacterized protein n=1 Tax=Protopolystoma xenopodis TaxID=117903 RepID=A0A3S5A0Z9_9PLAT|nr:unnamed protein product [Protopolystoma xenopodis]